ncbi:hypothetical protein [Novosphingobium terrae]|uniref:hypothetical protein n=1 Tax=Novosphingobium terrae TaxID=2726189 RepID=UPI00197F96C7|nr:hypothetical protein [Novosphingobium terrae]
MSKATFTTEAALRKAKPMAWLAGVAMLAGTCASAAPIGPATPSTPTGVGAGPIAGPQEQHAPASTAERLYRLDQLRADLEEAKLRAQIAKANQEAKGQGSTAAAMPPIPGLGMGASPALGLLPPLPTTSAPARPKGGLDTLPDAAPTVEVMETYGVGKDRQAIVNIGGAKRIVHVGDLVMGGTVVAIGTASISVRGSRGRLTTYN